MADPADTSEPDYSQLWRSGGAFTTAIHGLSGGAAGIVLFALMAVTMVDVVGRYVFSAPLPGGNEIVQILMAAIIYAALPSVCRQEAHITVDLLDGLTPRRVVPFRQMVMNAVGAAVMGTICWCLWLLAERLREDHETWEYLVWERAPVVYFMCVLSGIGAVIFLANLLRYLRGARGPKPGFI
ncbi:MAG: TRAP transporter small permease [Alphaproteobacteria bacterium]|nr:TRAP transporter small permease [Alphaproteobacteria bacterium]